MDTRIALSELTLPRRITAAYLAAGLTQDSFAKEMGEPVRVITDWEHYVDAPDLWQLNRIAKTVHLSKRELCFGLHDVEQSRRRLAAAEVVQLLAGASSEIGAAWAAFQGADRYTRTYVLTYMYAWQSARLLEKTAIEAEDQALVAAVRTDALTEAVALHVKPIDEREYNARLQRLPKSLSKIERAERLAAIIHELAGLSGQRSIQAGVLAVALGMKLTPQLDRSSALH